MRLIENFKGTGNKYLLFNHSDTLEFYRRRPNERVCIANRNVVTARAEERRNVYTRTSWAVWNTISGDKTM